MFTELQSIWNLKKPEKNQAWTGIKLSGSWSHWNCNSEVCKWIYEISLSVRNIPVYGKACKCIYDIFELSWKIWRQLLHNSRSCELHGHGFKSRSGFLILLSGFRRIILLWYALHVLRWFHAILPNWRQISRDDVCR